MRKHFTCLSFFVYCLSCLHAQDSLKETNSRVKPVTNASFVTLISTISQKANEQAITDKAPTLAHYDECFTAFAHEYGITCTQARELVNAWAQADSVKNEEEDLMLQGARNYYLKQFHTSSLYYEQAAMLQEESLAVNMTGAGGQDPALTTTMDATCTAYLLAGNSASEGGNFKRAIRLYRKADSLLLLQDTPAQKKSHVQDLLAIVLYEEGNRLGGDEGFALLTQAAALEQAALARYSPTAFPQEWARSQSNLGTILQTQGELVAGSAGDSLFLQSLSAYNAALTVYTKKDLPQEWARMQNNMGVVLSNLGAIEEAIAAFRAALEIYTRQDHPQDWALAQYNLGNMLQFRGSDTKGPGAINLFKESAAAYRLALEVYTEKESPEEWAWAQHHLGVSLFEQGRVTDGRTLLSEAVAAFRAALIVHTKECFPEAYASTQYNLGTVLWEESSRAATNSIILLEEAVMAYTAALDFYTQKDNPEQWFNTQNSLGLLQEQKQQWTAAIRHFENLRDMEPMYAAQKVNELRRKAGQ